MARRKGATAQPVVQLTDKQEAFALAYVETGNATEAYRRAYNVADNCRDSWIYVEAAQLLDHPKINPRIVELQAQAKLLSAYTIKAAADEYEEARKLAMKLENASAAVSAITGKVKLFGLEAPMRSRLEHVGKNGGPIQTEEVSAKDVIARRIARLAAGSRPAGDTGGSD